MTTSCSSFVHASQNLLFYALNNRSYGLKTLEHLSRPKKSMLKLEVQLAQESVLIPLVIHLNCEEYHNSRNRRTIFTKTQK